MMEAVGVIIVVVALAAGVMVFSSDDVNNESEMEMCFGLCMKIDHTMNKTTEMVLDPNNPLREEMQNE